jgi:hypothetical protein
LNISTEKLGKIDMQLRLSMIKNYMAAKIEEGIEYA